MWCCCWCHKWNNWISQQISSQYVHFTMSLFFFFCLHRYLNFCLCLFLFIITTQQLIQKTLFRRVDFNSNGQSIYRSHHHCCWTSFETKYWQSFMYFSFFFFTFHSLDKRQITLSFVRYSRDQINVLFKIQVFQVWEGSNDWIREMFANYLKCFLSSFVDADFGTSSMTHNSLMKWKLINIECISNFSHSYLCVDCHSLVI